MVKFNLWNTDVVPVNGLIDHGTNVFHCQWTIFYWDYLINMDTLRSIVNYIKQFINGNINSSPFHLCLPLTLNYMWYRNLLVGWHSQYLLMLCWYCNVHCTTHNESLHFVFPIYFLRQFVKMTWYMTVIFFLN